MALIGIVENKGPVAEKIRSLLKNQGFVVKVVGAGAGLSASSLMFCFVKTKYIQL